MKEDGMMNKYYEPSEMDAASVYKLLIGCVMPRPIAWISTKSHSGELNLAPFSFFNVASRFPPTLAISISQASDPSKGKKDTLRNIEETKELVVNVVSEELVEAMNKTATEFPQGVNEFEVVGLHTEESLLISAPRVLEAKISMECVLKQLIPLGMDTLVLAEVVRFVVNEEVIENGKIQPEKARLVGRMAGPQFSRSTDIFKINIPTLDEYNK
jgi:flavin reductase (DIM6/NTAB) family NADH-FMN oxidoreductase RutF